MTEAVNNKILDWDSIQGTVRTSGALLRLRQRTVYSLYKAKDKDDLDDKDDFIKEINKYMIIRRIKCDYCRKEFQNELTLYCIKVL